MPVVEHKDAVASRVKPVLVQPQPEPSYHDLWPVAAQRYFQIEGTPISLLQYFVLSWCDLCSKFWIPRSVHNLSGKWDVVLIVR